MKKCVNLNYQCAMTLNTLIYKSYELTKSAAFSNRDGIYIYIKQIAKTRYYLDYTKIINEVHISIRY